MDDEDEAAGSLNTIISSLWILSFMTTTLSSAWSVGSIEEDGMIKNFIPLPQNAKIPISNKKRKNTNK